MQIAHIHANNSITSSGLALDDGTTLIRFSVQRVNAMALFPHRHTLRKRKQEFSTSILSIQGIQTASNIPIEIGTIIENCDPFPNLMIQSPI